MVVAPARSGKSRYSTVFVPRTTSPGSRLIDTLGSYTFQPSSLPSAGVGSLRTLPCPLISSVTVTASPTAT